MSDCRRVELPAPLPRVLISLFTHAILFSKKRLWALFGSNYPQNLNNKTKHYIGVQI